MSINKVILIGSLGQDPKIGEKSGFKYASFSLATTKKWKDKNGEKKTETSWHSISCLGSMANICEYINKGSKIYLEGELKYEEYSDKQTGEVKKITKIICDKIDIIEGKSNQNKETKPNNHQKAKQNAYQPEEDEDLTPF
jgi:single-strand DNA-binding protein